MSSKKIYMAGAGLLALPLLVAMAFYHVVVGRDGLTNFWSVFFGWQLLVVGGFTIGWLVSRARKGGLRRGAAPLLVLIGTVLLVVIPSWVSTSTSRYITGEGGPAGPSFNCLAWEKSGTYDTYDATWGFACGVMSIPSYSKFWIDQRYEADETDASLTYYVAFAADEVVLLAGVGASFLVSRRAPRQI